MDKSIINKKFSQYQLVRTGIELVSAINGLLDCNIELKDNNHIKKVTLLSNRWNEEFIKLVVTKEGVQ